MTTRILRRDRAGTMSGTVQIDVMVGPNAAVARAVAGEHAAIGDSKRNHGEPFNSRVAADLAIGRALAALGDVLVDNAHAHLDS